MENVLFLCSANHDRSPTAEQVFRDVPGWNVKAAGTESYANIQVTNELLDWADQIFVMESHHRDAVLDMNSSYRDKTIVLGIEDKYHRNSAKLVAKLITKIANVVDLDKWIAMKFNLKPVHDNYQSKTEPKGEYYTEEKPGGPWARALYQMRKRKPFNEEEFQKDNRPERNARTPV